MPTWVPATVPAVGDKVPVAFPVAFGAWTAYTPVMTGFTPGNGVGTGRYCQVNKTIWFAAAFTFGTTSAAATAAPILTLPVAALNSVLTSMNLRGSFTHAGTFYQALPHVATTTTVDLWIPGASGVYTTPTTTTPFTWATGDAILLGGTYEAA